jgi:hypothetical protein
VPIFFAFAGTLLVVSGVRGTTTQLVTLLKGDFTGKPNYFEWLIAIVLIGAIGYIKELATISRLFMVLVLIGILFANKGFFAEFTQGTQASPLPASTPPTTTNVPPANNLPALPDLQTLNTLQDFGNSIIE